jgi:IclR family transcriptional regulator, KDG regulon repressor
MERLRDRCGETVYLVARDEAEAVGVLTVESNQMVRISSQPGKRWPLGSGAAGKVLLLGMSERDRERLGNCHPELIPHVRDAIQEFADQGVIYVDGEVDDIEDEHVRAYSVPVDNQAGHLELALAIAWPIGRRTADTDFFRTELLKSAAELSTALGGSSRPLRERSRGIAADPV